MRLGQLSRKLDLSTSKIVLFIEKEFEVVIENHPNTKIEDNFVKKIEQEFSPKVTIAEAEEISQKHIENDKEKVNNTKEEVVVETDLVDNSLDVEVDYTEIETIKAPKPKLKQIKVLRKIELPKTKKSEIVENTEKTIDNVKNIEKNLEILEQELKDSIEKPVNIKPKKHKYTRPNKTVKKQKTVEEKLAEKKEKEERIRAREEKLKKRQEEYEKKKRKDYYATKAASIKPPKKKKKKQVEVVNKEKKPLKEQDIPKTWIGKLIKWFKTND